MDKQRIEAVRAQWPKAKLIVLEADVDDGNGPQKIEVIAKVPRGPEVQMFRDTVAGGGRAKAPGSLVASCIVWPTGEELEQLLDEWPMLVESWVDVLLKRAGLAENAKAKNL